MGFHEPNIMKKLIRKILKEEVHPDYESLIECDNYKLGVNLKELKLIVYILKNYHKSVYGIKEAFKDLGIKNKELLLTKVILIITFNSGKTLMDAYKTKDVSKIYDGPFYSAEVEYYDDIYDDTEYVEVECDNCGGDGEEIDGEVCGDCNGSGIWETDVDVERIGYYRRRVIAKEPITKGLLGDDISDVEKNPNILTLSPVYIDGEYELVDDGGIDKDKEYRIEDIHSHDIIVSSEYIV